MTSFDAHREIDVCGVFEKTTGLPKAFQPDAPAAAMKEFFDEYGFLVIENALSQEEINSTIEEIWTHEDLLFAHPGIRQDDPSTWDDPTWPASDKGFLGSRTGADEICVWQNRQNLNVIRPFEILLGTDQLILNLDRYGVMRPTKGIKLLDGQIVDRPEWKTVASWLHCTLLVVTFLSCFYDPHCFSFSLSLSLSLFLSLSLSLNLVSRGSKPIQNT